MLAHAFGLLREDGAVARNPQAHLGVGQVGEAELQRRGCDIGRSTYEKYEAGELNIRASVIVELRRLYNCSYDDFFEGLDEGE